MAKYTLYGDGIHDDTDAIQEIIDNGGCEVLLPAPKVRYLISKPLIIPSNFKFKLPRYAEIKLADGSDCFMLQNKTVEKAENRSREFLQPFDKIRLWYYYDQFSPEKEDTCCNFEIEGGIWNFNNLNQRPNPIQTGECVADSYIGHVMFFYNVKNFRISNLTIKDPANFGVVLDTASYFTVENIVFDYNFGNPIAVNMDGIHLNGNCHYGVIKNLQGACYDDLVALNAYEGSGGDITNLEIDGIFSENCHSAVRLLTVQQQVKNITISNVFGTYYQYCIGFTKFYPGETTGFFDAITLQNIHASKSKRLPIQEAHMHTPRHFPFIWIQGDTVTKHLSIDHLYRREFENSVDTIHIEKNATVHSLSVRDVELENFTDQPCKKFANYGEIKRLYVEGIPDDEIINEGTITTLITDKSEK